VEITVSKGNHIAFSVASVRDFMKILKKKDIPYGDEDGQAGKFISRSDGVTQIYFKDPDGYLVEVNDVKQ
jgi:lactoylglutathione lyase